MIPINKMSETKETFKPVKGQSWILRTPVALLTQDQIKYKRAYNQWNKAKCITKRGGRAYTQSKEYAAKYYQSVKHDRQARTRTTYLENIVRRFNEQKEREKVVLPNEPTFSA
jgi:hypothetical protein